MRAHHAPFAKKVKMQQISLTVAHLLIFWQLWFDLFSDNFCQKNGRKNLLMLNSLILKMMMKNKAGNKFH